ncbi:MAG: L,D-transpeptidase, partial [Chloroflexota bacterium]|nr:L,D-transpeptidase [Chloroflexota bacterium]
VPVYAAALFDPSAAPATAAEPLARAATGGLAIDPTAAEEPIPAPVEEVVPEPVVPEVIGPGPQQGAYQEVVISISAQTLWAYEGNQLVNSTLVSTGTAEVPETTTPIGSHTILSKVDVQDMEGTISGEYYFVPDVPYVMYFDGLGNALHGTYWHSNFGAPMSHGCVNLPLDVAAWIYGWASVGTAVTVIP